MWALSYLGTREKDLDNQYQYPRRVQLARRSDHALLPADCRYTYTHPMFLKESSLPFSIHVRNPAIYVVLQLCKQNVGDG